MKHLFIFLLITLLSSCRKVPIPGCYECKFWNSTYEKKEYYCNENNIPKTAQDPQGNDLNIHCEKR